MNTEKLIVDNRLFVLGLDELYRNVIKTYEKGELLKHARNLAGILELRPADCAVEGYYYEEPGLTEYFQLMRSLQNVSISELSKVEQLPSYIRLKSVTMSPIFGNSFDQSYLLPGASNPFNHALKKIYPDWSIETIIQNAYQLTTQSEDFSLVSIAVLTKDPVVIAGLRETVALYVAAVAGCAPDEPVKYEYIWEVDPLLENRAKSFVETFNKLFNDELPFPEEKNAKLFYEAAGDSNLYGRCICIGTNDNRTKHYHWAIKYDDKYNFIVEDFWDEKIVTTEQYRENEYS